MPIYDYKCRSCEHMWEVMHSIYEDADTLGLTCPECASRDIFRYLGNYGGAIKLVGTGFAANDLALDAIGMPEATRNSPEAKKKLFR